MNKIFKSTILTLCASAVVASSAFASSSLLPVRETLEKEGFDISWDQATKSVTITKDNFSLTEAVGDNFVLFHDTTYAPEEFFANVYESAKESNDTYSTVTVTEVGENYFMAEDSTLGLVEFLVDDNTNIHHEKNKMAYRLSDLEEGMTVKVNMADAMTLSLPPQVYAYEVVITNNSVAIEEGNTHVSYSASVTEIGEDYVIAETSDIGTVRFNVDESTNIHHEKNKMAYRLSDLEEGMNITLDCSEAMTKSIPPQVYAYEIVISE
jgi:hypothetical protein